MLSLTLLAVLAAEPLVVVVPVEVMAPDGRIQALRLGLQSVLEADLKAAGVPVRTEDDLDASHWGKIQGATHVLICTVMNAGREVALAWRLVELPQEVVGTGRGAFLDRERVVKGVLTTLGRKAPAYTLLKVDLELAESWGEALATLKDGEPARARDQVAAVAKKWPAFTPAKERLQQLGP
ncbi:MAG: hypothetical protein U0228_16885 [Myxococcaceae bacterium]